MLIRLAKEPDCIPVATLMATVIAAQENYTPEAREVHVRANSQAHLMARIRHSPALLLVAEVDGGIAGAATFDISGGVLFVPWICVAESARHLRIGPALYDAAFAQGRERGCHKASGVSLTSNRGVLRYLKRIGGNQVGLLKNHWFGQDYLMWDMPL